MTNRKNQNPIFVVATLGVYLGLVMAGAVPQVLASAALTRAFDVRDEIEFKDDLDNKPDGDRTPVRTSVQVYLEDVEYFLFNLGQLSSSGKFDPKRDTFEVVQNTLLPCVDSNLAGRYTPVKFDTSSDSARSPLAYFTRGMTYGYSLGDCVANSEFNGVNGAASAFNLKLDQKGLTVWLEVKKESPQNAQELKRSLDAALKLFSSTTNTKLRQRVVEHTRFAFQGVQVTVTLHLARSDLTSLFAADAK